MKLTYYGHACFGIETRGVHLLFDPFITGNELASAVDVDAIPADYILLSHGHEDHVLDVERIAKRSGAKIISNFEIVSWFGRKGLEGHPMNHGGQWTFDFGTVKCVTAIHSSVLPDGTYGGNPAGFVVWNEEVCFYFAGDTALTVDMQLIPKLCPKLDFCILPVGDNFTMGYEEAVLAADFVDCHQVVACHFDTFGFIRIDRDRVEKAFADAGKSVILPTIGQEVAF